MKKIIASTLVLAFGGMIAFSQGTITIANTAAGYLISTNNGSGGVGVAGTGANSYYYAVLTAAYPGSGAPSTNIANASVLSQWTFTGVQAANNALTKGGIGTPGTTSTGSTWAAPTGATYNTGTIQYYVIVGWSANYGTTWSQVASLINGSGLTPGGYFGTSLAAYNYSGGGPQSLAAVNLLNAPGQTGLAGAGLTSGFQLNLVTAAPVPEPGTMALAALGGASLLLFRRRK